MAKKKKQVKKSASDKPVEKSEDTGSRFISEGNTFFISDESGKPLYDPAWDHGTMQSVKKDEKGNIIHDPLTDKK